MRGLEFDSWNMVFFSMKRYTVLLATGNERNRFFFVWNDMREGFVLFKSVILMPLFCGDETSLI